MIGEAQCPKCHRTVKTVDGFIINHREREDRRGYGNGAFCAYSENEKRMTIQNTPMCKRCGVKPRANKSNGRPATKCTGCLEIEREYKKGQYVRAVDRNGVNPDTKMAHSLLEAERKLNDSMLAELKQLKAAARKLDNEERSEASLREFVKELENNNVELLTQIDDLQQQVKSLKDKYEPASGPDAVRVVPQEIPAPLA